MTLSNLSTFFFNTSIFFFGTFVLLNSPVMIPVSSPYTPPPVSGNPQTTQFGVYISRLLVFSASVSISLVPVIIDVAIRTLRSRMPSQQYFSLRHHVPVGAWQKSLTYVFSCSSSPTSGVIARSCTFEYYEPGHGYTQGLSMIGISLKSSNAFRVEQESGETFSLEHSPIKRVVWTGFNRQTKVSVGCSLHPLS